MYFLVNKNSETHRIIEEQVAKGIAANKARWKFVEREFPEAKKKNSGWKLCQWSGIFGGGGFGVVPPQGYTMPTHWRLSRSKDHWLPKVSTDAGKKLAEEMRDDKYVNPGATDIGKALGIKLHWEGLHVSSCAFLPTNDGRWIIDLHEGQKQPMGCKRISDIQKEKLTVARKGGG